jgi:dTDP-4-dehydrorhamnose 3,5-epimerase
VRVERTTLEGVLVLEPRVFEDARGWFFESWNRRAFREATGVEADFVQDNHSRSARNVLRGLHYQVKHPQGKLVRITAGEAYDVAVDLRRSSRNFGKTVGVTLDARSRRMLWIPAGFAHGFLALADGTEMQYKTTDYYAPEHERTLLWNDRQLGIDWPLKEDPVLNEKDRLGVALAVAETFD